MTHHFCKKLKKLLTWPDTENVKIVYYTSTRRKDIVNAAFLMGAYMLLHLEATPEQAWRPFCKLSSFLQPYRDATWSPSTFDLTLLHCFQGLRKAVETQLYHTDTFDQSEYFQYDSPERGDLHEVVKGKFLAFRGPSDSKLCHNTLKPSFYCDIFKAKNVAAIVRLNENAYDPKPFLDAGFDHHDLLFVDCSTPSDPIVHKFLQICEETEGLLAVHCLTGLGCTGTLISLYMMKHMGFTANECIAWLRIVRPGSVIGQQQQYLESQELRMHLLGSGNVHGLGLSSEEGDNGCDNIFDATHPVFQKLAGQVLSGMKQRDVDKRRCYLRNYGALQRSTSCNNPGLFTSPSNQHDKPRGGTKIKGPKSNFEEPTKFNAYSRTWEVTPASRLDTTDNSSVLGTLSSIDDLLLRSRDERRKLSKKLVRFKMCSSTSNSPNSSPSTSTPTSPTTSCNSSDFSSGSCSVPDVMCQLTSCAYKVTKPVDRHVQFSVPSYDFPVPSPLATSKQPCNDSPLTSPLAALKLPSYDFPVPSPLATLKLLNRRYVR